MRKNTLLFAFSLFCISPLVAFTAHAASTTIDADRVIAVVNNEAVTNYDLNTRIDNAKENLTKQGIALPSPEELKRQVLERLIMEKLQLQAATDAGITVTDSDLDAALRRIADNNHLTLDAFKAALEKDNISWTKFREEVRQQIIMARVRDREVDSRVTISDAEIDNYLNSAEARGDSAEYLISHIIVRLPEQAGPEQIAKQRAKIEEAQRRLQQGEDFAKVAAAYSDGPEAMSGGSIGVRTRDQLPPLYADAVANMKPGNISPILRSAAGFHIIKLVDKRGGKLQAQSTQQTHVRHILIKTTELVSDAEAKRKIDEIKAKLDNGGDFAALAKQYSDDPSANSGGDLGWLDQGVTVPEFQSAMDALPLNKVSDPVKSQFGWHLIEVLGRRNTSNDPAQLRMAARQTLRERRADEAYQDWLRQLRDNAYVEYRLDDR
ncbi:MAG TPA: peptidylprolyl isomerase [Rhodocyclaceae bacterium]|nr:peptidylprolyl isomerase [Rhodocyclaceae bacterium]